MRRFVVLGAVAAVSLAVSGCASCPCEVEPAVELPEAPVDPGWAQRSVDTTIQVEFPEPFVRLVDFSRLRVGMTKAEVLAVFPDPDETRLRQGDDIWRYGFAELIFRDDRLRDWFNL